MNKAQIKAELRRSACEDSNPYYVNNDAFIEVRLLAGNPIGLMPDSEWRILFLLVAEAL